MLLRRVATALAATAAVFLVAFQISENLDRAKVVELVGLQAPFPKVHSVGYYESLAEADVWQAGPKSQELQANIKFNNARTQDLSEVHSTFSGKVSTALVKACANGDDSACSKIASDSKQLNALEQADSKPESIVLPRRAQKSESDATLSSTGDGGAKSTAKATVAATGSGNLWDTKSGMWDPQQWQSSGVNDAVSSQWLQACTDGDWNACDHISRSDNALSQLLHATSKPGGEPLENYMEPKSVPTPVYVAARRPEKDDSMFGEVLSALGLADNFYNSGVKSAQEPAKMIPDVGLTGKGSKAQAVWNDGTIATGLSDDKTPAQAVGDIKKHIKHMTSSLSSVFSDNVASPLKPVDYH